MLIEEPEISKFDSSIIVNNLGLAWLKETEQKLHKWILVA